MTVVVLQGSSVIINCTVDDSSQDLLWRIQFPGAKTVEYSQRRRQLLEDMGYFESRQSEQNISLHINNTDSTFTGTGIACLDQASLSNNIFQTTLTIIHGKQDRVDMNTSSICRSD